MPIAKSLADIPFNTMDVGDYWHLVDFTPDMIAEARLRLQAQAKALGGYRAVIRSDPSPMLFIGLTEAQAIERAMKANHPGAPGRPPGIEARLIANLPIGGSTDLSARGRSQQSIRNLASRTATRHGITIKASAMDGGETFRVTRLK